MSLFNEEYYTQLHSKLAPGGILVSQVSAGGCVSSGTFMIYSRAVLL